MAGPKLGVSVSRRHDWPEESIETGDSTRKVLIISHQSFKKSDIVQANNSLQDNSYHMCSQNHSRILLGNCSGRLLIGRLVFSYQYPHKNPIWKDQMVIYKFLSLMIVSLITYWYTIEILTHLGENVPGKNHIWN